MDRPKFVDQVIIDLKNSNTREADDLVTYIQDLENAALAADTKFLQQYAVKHGDVFMAIDALENIKLYMRKNNA